MRMNIRKGGIMMDLTEAAHRMAESSWHSSNSTFTSTVVIRVTPKDDFLVSWGILWLCFVLTALVALWQVLKERRIIMPQKRHQSGDAADHQAEEISTADGTRSQFRCFLLAALVARILLMPLQIWSDPMILQFVCDSLPEMIWACAWSTICGFFVEMVGIATGGVTNNAPGVVMLLTALSLYFCLVLLQLENSVASVLLYALFCCIYAALLGTVIYFSAKLWTILKPSLENHPGALIRLMISCGACIALFGAHVVTYAQQVILTPSKVYWWWHYGALELLPSIVFLVIMKVGSKREGPEASSSSTTQRRRIPRTDSASSAISKKSQEGVGLLRPLSYGSTDN